MVYKGIIIEESLLQPGVLKDVKTLDIRIRTFGKNNPQNGKTQWIIRSVEIPEEKIALVAERLSKALDPAHSWYAHFKNSTTHYVIFSGRVFVIDCFSKLQYEQMLKYAHVLGINTAYLEPPPAACKEWEF